MYIYVCMCVCVCVHKYVCMCMYIYIYICLCMCIYFGFLFLFSLLHLNFNCLDFSDYADDRALITNTPAQAQSLLHNLDQPTGGISLYMNVNKTE